MTAVYYELAVDSWLSPDTIVVNSGDGQVIASFPVPFIRKGGDNTWDYIFKVVEQLIVARDQYPWVLRRNDGQEIDSHQEPEAGQYLLVESGCADGPLFARGPEYFRRFQPPNPGGSSSTRSDSKRSTVNQSRFRSALLARDGTCLVTDVEYTNCTACHIVPFSRPDVYQNLLRINREPPMFHASVGLLLRDDLHHAFDRLEFSLYLKHGVLFVHFFVLNYPGAEDLHGKAVGPERFRGNPNSRPNPVFVRWHYNQCIKAHIRGFSSGMA